MSGVGVSRGGHGRRLPSGRVAVLGVLVVLALIVGSVLIGRWSASMQVAPAGESRPTFSVPGPVGQTADRELPGSGIRNGGGLNGGGLTGGGLAGGGTVCLLARPC